MGATQVRRWGKQDQSPGTGLCSVGLFLLLALILAPSAAMGACPNEAFRSGPSAQLPDCRAYELVTPSDSNGRLIADPNSADANYDAFPTELVSPSRHSFIFGTRGTSFETPEGGGGRQVGDTWLAERQSVGWQVMRHITPDPVEAQFFSPGGISSDHQYGFAFVTTQLKSLPHNGTLGEGGDASYLGDPTGSFELTGIGSLGVERLAQGRYISPGGEHVLFSTGKSAEESTWCFFLDPYPKVTCAVARLEPEAPPTGTGAIYDRAADGPSHVVSLLPGDLTPLAGENAIYQGASADATSVAFKIGGTLYVRADNGEADARTEKVAAEPTTFGGFSADGTYLFYVGGGNIHRLNTETEADEEVHSSGDGEMVNVSADGSHVYFVSPSQLDDADGTIGEPNLYVWSGGAIRYIATVTESDTSEAPGVPALTKWTSDAVSPNHYSANPGPGNATSRTTPDGDVIVFESKAPLTPPYDNAGHSEIYRYDDVDGSLKCVSCNPSGQPAVADAKLQSPSPALQPTAIIHNVTGDGSRVFFETDEALVDGDIDSVNDVYEWEETEVGSFVALISSGNSTEFAQVAESAPNVLMGVSPDGSDVFFRSLDPLLPGAPGGGAPAIYDARINGGFPRPPALSVCLDLGSCRPGGTSAPSLAGVNSASLAGSGNVKPRHRHRCKRRQGHGKHSQKRRHCRGKKHGGGR
jgi:hypothetical protein